MTTFIYDKKSPYRLDLVPITMMVSKNGIASLEESFVNAGLVRYIIFAERNSMLRGYLSVTVNAELVFYSGKTFSIISSIEEFVRIGWRPYWWWYDAQFDGTVPGDDDFKFSDDDRNQENKNWEWAMRDYEKYQRQ